MKNGCRQSVCTKIGLPEVRCRHCSRLLFCGIVENVEIKCPRCSFVQTIDWQQQVKKVMEPGKER